MNELLHTERTYVADLKCIIQVQKYIPCVKIFPLNILSLRFRKVVYLEGSWDFVSELLAFTKPE